MKLYRKSGTPAYPATAVFRESRLQASIVVLVMTGFTAGAVWLGYAGEGLGRLFLWGVCVPSCLLVTLIALRVSRATFGPDNWLVRYAPDGLLIQLRSYLNSHLPDEDETVAWIPTSEIRAASRTDLRREVPDSDRGTTVEKSSYLDLRLRHPRTEELAEALRRERSRGAGRDGSLGKTKFHHYPVALPEPDLVRILWSGPRSRVRPGLGRILRLLSERVPLEEGSRIKRSIPEASEGRALDDYIVELIETGDRIGAVKLVRLRYGYGLEKARIFVDELAGRANANDAQSSWTG